MSKKFKSRYKYGDVRKLNDLRNSISGDIIINLAATHRDNIRNKLEYEKTNVLGAENIISICKEKNIKKIIFTSTVAVYGFVEKVTNEYGKINPFNEYGKTKFKAEEKFREWQIQTNNSLIIVRPTVVFGEGNRGNVYNLMNQIHKNQFIMVGRGDNKKSIAYVRNVVSFLEACILEKKKFCVFNYVDQPTISMNELVLLIRKKLKNKDNTGIRLPYIFALLLGFLGDFLTIITNKKFPINSIRLKKFVSSTEFSNVNKISRGFTPPFQLSDALERTLHKEFISLNSDHDIFDVE